MAPSVTKDRLFVVVSGPPASGKSSLAPLIAAELGLPLLAKDVIKDALMSELPVPDLEASRRLGRAAVAVLLAAAVDMPRGAVLESVFHRSAAAGGLAALPGRVVEVFCRCPRAVLEDRYRARAGSRQAGYFDRSRSPEELWNPEVAEPVAGGWPVLEVDTSSPVDIASLADAVRRQSGFRADQSGPTDAS